MEARGLLLLAIAGMLSASHGVWQTSAAESISVRPPAITDNKGNVVEDIVAGQQVTIHYEYNKTGNQPQPFVMLFEIRDDRGVSVHFAWQSGVAEPNTEATVGISWTPEERGDHEIRIFVIDGFDNPQGLSTVVAHALFVG